MTTGSDTVFAKMANLHSYVRDLQHKHNVLKITLIGSATLNLALIILVLWLA